MTCAPCEDSDPPSLIRVFAVRMKNVRVLSFPLSTQQRLWSDWAEARLICLRLAHVILLVLSCCGPNEVYSRCQKLGRVKRIWYLSPMRQRRFRWACASAQTSQNLRCSLIQAVSQEEPSDRKRDPWPLWTAGHAQLKFVMTECSKTQIRLTGLN